LSIETVARKTIGSIGTAIAARGTGEASLVGCIEEVSLGAGGVSEVVTGSIK
jgi:hypothetical protein